jgi:RNA ligase (TIGR02306 family)
LKKKVLKKSKTIKMENLNSVCYVGAIGEIVPIIGADNLELALVGGWQAVVKKGEYKVGNLVVIATTDAVIPQDLSDAMGVTNYLRKGGRVRTVKLRGVYSECLIIPFNMLVGRSKFVKTWKEGDDMMEVLGIFKYEPPAVQVQLASGRKIKYHQNPNFGVYYKFPNLKNVAGMFTEQDNVQITRKLHGTNARYGIVKKSRLSFWDKVRKFFGNEWAGYEYVYGSHNVEKGSDSQGFYDTDVWRTVAEKLNIKDKLWEFVKQHGTAIIGEGFIIYGEIYGAGIQKNYDYGLKDIEFAGFDVVIDGCYENVFYTEHVFNILGLPHVPILYVGAWSQEIQDSFVFNNFIGGTKVPHEGIVIKNISGERNKVAKVINPDYLIYGEKHNVGDSH